MYKSECEIFGNHERENDDQRFWDVTSYRLYGGKCYLHIRSRRYFEHRNGSSRFIRSLAKAVQVCTPSITDDSSGHFHSSDTHTVGRVGQSL